MKAPQNNALKQTGGALIADRRPQLNAVLGRQSRREKLMGFHLQYFVIDTREPTLWVAIVTASVAAALLGVAVGRRAATNGGKRAVALAALDLVVLLPLLLAAEVILLSVLFALRTGGEACLPLVWYLLLIPAGVGLLTTILSWRHRCALAAA